MSTKYLVINGHMPTTAPASPVTTSTTLFTMLQVMPSANTPCDLVAWWVSFSGAALAAPFVCDVVDTGTVAATVTAFASADIMLFDDYGATANSAGTTGVPFNLGTAQSGFTSSAEGTITTTRVFDWQQVDPVGTYRWEFSLGGRPRLQAGHATRIRVHGDGSTTVACGMLLEV